VKTALPDDLRPIALPEGVPGDPMKDRLYRLVRPGLERLLRIEDLNDVHEAACAEDGPARPGGAFDRMLEPLGVDWEIAVGDLDRIPREGPLVVVANHPFGGLEGIVLGAVLKRVRPDARILVTRFLHAVRLLRPDFFFVDNFGGAESVRRNVGVLREVTSFVAGGGCLGVFPAGEVSHATWKRPRVADPPWLDTTARIARRTGATVVPICFDGRNSLSFQVLGLVHPRLRTIMLPTELMKRRGRTIRLAVGRPVPPPVVARAASDAELTGQMRARTYLLQGRMRRDGSAPSLAGPDDAADADRGLAPIAPTGDPVRLAEEIARVGDEATLVRAGRLRVVHMNAADAPAMMDEIGRLREVTFRAVGEGTGRSRDLDRFDRTYLHLVVLDDEAGEIVGAYRMGLTDRILEREGVRGLYTHTLFQYRARLLEEIGPAIELGRSFVRGEHQRSYAPLMLLWKGIGTYACRHPRYRHLFGPVSISNEYASTSRALLVHFLEATRSLEPMQRLVKPRRPVRPGPLRRLPAELDVFTAGTLDELDDLIREIEDDRRAMPVLLRQYLKLNAKLLGFNVDPDFGDVVDGLMLVDLAAVDPRVLRHYMGAEAAATFLERHGSGRA